MSKFCSFFLFLMIVRVLHKKNEGAFDASKILRKDYVQFKQMNAKRGTYQAQSTDAPQRGNVSGKIRIFIRNKYGLVNFVFKLKRDAHKETAISKMQLYYLKEVRKNQA